MPMPSIQRRGLTTAALYDCQSVGTVWVSPKSSMWAWSSDTGSKKDFTPLSSLAMWTPHLARKVRPQHKACSRFSSRKNDNSFFPVLTA
eukprot:1084402-Alexandrium_andersonii.AAC.1